MPALGLGLGLPFQRGCGARNALDVLTQLGLTTGAKLILDAGDAASYSSGQSWLDRSGNGYDFFRGTDNTSQASDPTFNGSAGGLSASEYWSFDGGDYFTYDSTNETWMQNLHKDNAVFTLMTWVRLGSVGTTQGLFGSYGSPATNIGIFFCVTSANTLSLLMANGSGSLGYNQATVATLSADTWYCLGIRMVEGVGMNWFINGATETDSANYGSPSASNASLTMQIGARGGGANPLLSGSRMAMAMVWEGTALSTDQMTSIYSATRGRFGV